MVAKVRVPPSFRPLRGVQNLGTGDLNQDAAILIMERGLQAASACDSEKRRK